MVNIYSDMIICHNHLYKIKQAFILLLILTQSYNIRMNYLLLDVLPFLLCCPVFIVSALIIDKDQDWRCLLVANIMTNISAI